jgi:hypothetical protein
MIKLDTKQTLSQIIKIGSWNSAFNTVYFSTNSRLNSFWRATDCINVEPDIRLNIKNNICKHFILGVKHD